MFTDTPGFHKPRTAFGVRLNGLVGDAVAGVDVVLHVVDAASGVGRGDAYVAERQVKASGSPAFCIVNKIDAVRGHDEVPQLGGRRRPRGLRGDRAGVGADRTGRRIISGR